jgi:hypothetical protein
MPHFKVPNLITSSRFPLPQEVTYSEAPRIKIWTSLEVETSISEFPVKVELKKTACESFCVVEGRRK